MFSFSWVTFNKVINNNPESQHRAGPRDRFIQIRAPCSGKQGTSHLLMEPIPSLTGQKVGNTLESPPLHHKSTAMFRCFWSSQTSLSSVPEELPETPTALLLHCSSVKWCRHLSVTELDVLSLETLILTWSHLLGSSGSAPIKKSMIQYGSLSNMAPKSESTGWLGSQRLPLLKAVVTHPWFSVFPCHWINHSIYTASIISLIGE